MAAASPRDVPKEAAQQGDATAAKEEPPSPKPSEAMLAMPPPAAATPVPSEAPSSLVQDTDHEADVQVHCGCCRKIIDEQNAIVVCRASAKKKASWRCKSCHACRSAIQRLQNRHGQLIQEFQEIDSKDKLESFYGNFSHLRGSELVHQINSLVEICKVERTTHAFQGSGEYFDQEDLEKMYDGKPTQLSNVLQNANKYFDPVRKVWLYEDTKYRRTSKDEVEITKSQRVKGRACLAGNDGSAGNGQDDEDEDPEPCGGKQRGRGRKRKQAAEDDDLPKLKAGQIKKLNKKLETLNTKRLTCLDLAEKARALESMVPQYVIDATQDAIQTATKEAAYIEAAVGACKGHHDKLLEKADACVEKLQDNEGRIKCQIDLATAFKKM